MTYTARYAGRFAHLTADRGFQNFGIFCSGSYFEVRGITISPPWEHSSPNVTQLNRAREYGQSTTQPICKTQLICKTLTQHAKINSECNKLMQPSKSVLKHETNIKTTFKIMNAHAKLIMTLNHGI